MVLRLAGDTKGKCAGLARPVRKSRDWPYFLASAWATSQSCWVFCMVKPWPLHAFWPLHALLACLQAPWPLQDEEFTHLTAALSPAAVLSAADAVIEVTANRPATAR